MKDPYLVFKGSQVPEDATHHNEEIEPWFECFWKNRSGRWYFWKVGSDLWVMEQNRNRIPPNLVEIEFCEQVNPSVDPTNHMWKDGYPVSGTECIANIGRGTFVRATYICEFNGDHIFYNHQYGITKLDRLIVKERFYPFTSIPLLDSALDGSPVLSKSDMLDGLGKGKLFTHVMFRRSEFIRLVHGKVEFNDGTLSSLSDFWVARGNLVWESGWTTVS